jgi:hypothetical protein
MTFQSEETGSLSCHPFVTFTYHNQYRKPDHTTLVEWKEWLCKESLDRILGNGTDCEGSTVKRRDSGSALGLGGPGLDGCILGCPSGSLKLLGE